MSNLYISSDFSGLDALIPQGRRVFVVIDSNLKPFFGLFERYELIPIQTSEKVKTLATVEYIIEQLLDRGADRSSFLVGVGGGITWESDPEFEYEEMMQKAKAVLEAIAAGERRQES